MSKDPDFARRERIAEVVAQARLNVLICRERSSRGAEQMADMQEALAEIRRSIDDAKKTISRLHAIRSHKAFTPGSP